MALSGDVLGNAVGTALYNNIPSDVLACMSEDQKAAMCQQLVDNWKLIAGQIVSHITGNAVVTVNAGIAVTAGSCTGATTSPGTGSIS